jgi:hypothetical protein
MRRLRPGPLHYTGIPGAARDGFASYPIIDDTVSPREFPNYVSSIMAP